MYSFIVLHKILDISTFRRVDGYVVWEKEEGRREGRVVGRKDPATIRLILFDALKSFTIDGKNAVGTVFRRSRECRN